MRYIKTFEAEQLTLENIKESATKHYGYYFDNMKLYANYPAGPGVIFQYPKDEPRRIARIGDYLVIEDGSLKVYTEELFNTIFKEFKDE